MKESPFFCKFFNFRVLLDELLYGRVGGEETAHVGVHVVVGAKGQGHLNTLE